MLLSKSYTGFSFLDFWKLVWDPERKLETNLFLRIPDTLVWKPGSAQPPQYFFFSRKQNRILKKIPRNFSLHEIYKNILTNRSRFRFANKVKNFRQSHFPNRRRCSVPGVIENSEKITSRRSNSTTRSRSMKNNRIVAIYFHEEERKSLSRETSVRLKLLTINELKEIFQKSDEIMCPQRSSMIQTFVVSHKRSQYEHESNFDSFYFVEYNHHTHQVPPRVIIKPKVYKSTEDFCSMRMIDYFRVIPKGFRTNIHRTTHGIVGLITRKIIDENRAEPNNFLIEEDVKHDDIRVTEFSFVCKEDSQGNIVFCYPVKLTVVVKSSIFINSRFSHDEFDQNAASSNEFKIIDYDLGSSLYAKTCKTNSSSQSSDHPTNDKSENNNNDDNEEPNEKNEKTVTHEIFIPSFGGGSELIHNDNKTKKKKKKKKKKRIPRIVNQNDETRIPQKHPFLPIPNYVTSTVCSRVRRCLIDPKYSKKIRDYELSSLMSHPKRMKFLKRLSLQPHHHHQNKNSQECHQLPLILMTYQNQFLRRRNSCLPRHSRKKRRKRKRRRKLKGGKKSRRRRRPRTSGGVSNTSFRRHRRMSDNRCCFDCICCLREEVEKDWGERDNAFLKIREELRFSKLNILDSESYYSTKRENSK